MPNKKNIIEVKPDEKRLYQIATELKKHQIVKIDNVKGWDGTLRKFGVRANNLIDSGIIDPIWRNKKDNSCLIRIDTVNNDVEITESGNNIRFFKFNIKKRRRIL